MKTKFVVLLSVGTMLGWVGSVAVCPASAAPGVAAPQAAAKAPAWKNQDEYKDFTAITSAKDPATQAAAADAFLKKHPDSDFKDLADIAKMGAYQQLGKSDQAIAAGRDALKINPNNLDALSYLCFAFPFVYSAKAPDAAQQGSQAEADAKHGLEVLSTLQKPANVSDDAFTQYVKAKRAIFNGTAGFAALQRKDFPAAMTALNAALQDNPSDPLAASWLGQAYLGSNPPDYKNAIWYSARAAALAKAANSPNAAALNKYFDQVYVSRHGSNAGENDILTQAASSVTPPAGFDVAQAPKHAATGNELVDAFYSYEDALKAGGDTEKQQWEGVNGQPGLKGQPFGGLGYVDSVEKNPDGTFTVHIDITNDAKTRNGVYDIDLKDSQPGCKDLAATDPVRFKGVMGAYTLTPSFVLTLDQGTIDDEDLAEAAAKRKAAEKPAAKKAPVHHHTTPRSQ